MAASVSEDVHKKRMYLLVWFWILLVIRRFGVGLQSQLASCINKSLGAEVSVKTA
jgi:hypothetical protein